MSKLSRIRKLEKRAEKIFNKVKCIMLPIGASVDASMEQDKQTIYIRVRI